ncbi:hypothetical protein BH20ACT9_BH20ACT9_16820 [soil metagenome]
MTASPPPTAPVAPARRMAFNVVALLTGLLAGFVVFGLPSLVSPWFASGDQVLHRVHDFGWGVLMGLIVAVGAFAQLRRAEEKVAGAQQVAAAAVALLLVALLVLPPNPLPTVLAVLAALLVYLHPARARVLRGAVRPSPAMAAVALAGAVPLLWYAVAQAGTQRGAPATDPHTELLHYGAMAAMALALALVAGLGAMRTVGWQIPALCAGLGAVWFGLGSAAFPDSEGSFGLAGGVLAVLGGIAYLVAAQRETRRASPGRSRVT